MLEYKARNASPVSPRPIPKDLLTSEDSNIVCEYCRPLPVSLAVSAPCLSIAATIATVVSTILAIKLAATLRGVAKAFMFFTKGPKAFPFDLINAAEKLCDLSVMPVNLFNRLAAWLSIIDVSFLPCSAASAACLRFLISLSSLSNMPC